MIGGVNAAKEKQGVIHKQIRILENRLDKVRPPPLHVLVDGHCMPPTRLTLPLLPCCASG